MERGDVMVSRLAEILDEMFLKEEAEESMFVCLECIGDTWLKGRPSKRVMPQACASCETSTLKALTSKTIAETIKDKLSNHFAIDYGLYPGNEMTLSEIVGRAIRCESEAVCNAVAERLIDLDADEEHFYFQGQEYCPASGRFESKEHERQIGRAHF